MDEGGSGSYVSCVLDDARAFANHAKKKAIDNDDVKLAVMMQLEKVFTTPPPRDLLLEVARTKNSSSLPLVKSHCGLRLPPDRYCFSSCNYKLKYSKRSSELNKTKFTLSGNSGLSSSLKVTKNAGAVSMVKRPPNVASVARTQSLTSLAKPVMKITTSPMMVSGQAQQMIHAKAKIQQGGQHQQVQQQLQPQQIEVKIEPQDTSDESVSLKRKRENEEQEEEGH
ncbi:transcription initiation factor TFIID subunit 9 isoform X2 [Cimex lectularius]|uniref:Uncharacterized protein n=1 Tax=Cimex lectularius TaxID=79782 RepID=A0A8I6SLM7_CIMLE|nr:transcription initiation factor TFIID subunit 9 isoform X2 [Cimex lectularius]